MLFQEALVWKRLAHPNIVPFIGVMIDPPQIASQWMPHGRLTTYAKSNPQKQVPLVSLSLRFSTLGLNFYQLIDVAKGLDYLHSHGVIHGDLKGVSAYRYLLTTSLIDHSQPNILVDDSGRARITDFGISRDTLSVAFVPDAQSLRWTAPEVLAKTSTPSTEADVFSFGMVMFEVHYNSITARTPGLTAFCFVLIRFLLARFRLVTKFPRRR